MKLTNQQRALLEHLDHAVQAMQTTSLYGVRADYGGRIYRIGEPAGSVLRRMEQRGLVISEKRAGRTKWWSITAAGAAALTSGEQRG